MDKRTIANQLLADFGRTLTVATLSLDEHRNSCVLAFDDELILNIEFDVPTERLVFSIYLDELPAQGAEPLLRELLGANLYWHRTRGATLSLEEGTNGVILVFSRSLAELDGPILETIVENLLQQAEKWRARIAAFQPVADASAQVPVPASFGSTSFTPIFG